MSVSNRHKKFGLSPIMLIQLELQLYNVVYFNKKCIDRNQCIIVVKNIWPIFNQQFPKQSRNSAYININGLCDRFYTASGAVDIIFIYVFTQYIKEMK